MQKKKISVRKPKDHYPDYDLHWSAPVESIGAGTIYLEGAAQPTQRIGFMSDEVREFKLHKRLL